MSVTESDAEPFASIAPSAVPSLMLMFGGKPPDGAVSVTVNVSLPSTSSSSVRATVNVFASPVPVAPAAKVSVPLVLVKSDAAAVSPVSILVA